ncbi:MAG TPA: hypothetical protein V6D20_06165 [Candidatus Obscuribacterales bacterium]
MSEIQMSPEDQAHYEEELALVEAGVLDADQVSAPQEATEEDLAWLPTEKQD